MTDTAAPSAPAAPAAPAAPTGGTPTHVTMVNQPPAAPAEPKAGEPATPAAPAAPAAPDAKPDAAAMKAYLADKAKDVSLEGKSEADIEKLYTDIKAKEPTDFKLPDAYKEKSWASKIKSQDDLYKQLDNLTAAVGKKTVVPNLKEATPEEREAFYSQLRGKDAAEYPMPENKGVPVPADTQPAVAKLFMDNGISPAQAEPFLKGYLELREKQIAEYYNPEVFKTTMETEFGKDWEATTGAVRKTISTMMSPDDQKALDNIPNNLLGVVYRTLGNTINAVNKTLEKYGAKETFAHLSAPGGKVAATDLTSTRQGLRDQLAALSMRPHTAAEQQEIISQLNKTYENDPRLQQQG